MIFHMLHQGVYAPEGTFMARNGQRRKHVFIVAANRVFLKCNGTFSRSTRPACSSGLHKKAPHQCKHVHTSGGATSQPKNFTPAH